MRYGFVKVCAASPEIRVADVNYNTQNIIKAIKESSSNGSQLTVFPELSICGYTCGDLFNQRTLLDGVKQAIAEIREATKGIKTLVFIGAPIEDCDRLYNCAVAISDGKILGVVPKTHLPNYGEFYEKRHFSNGFYDCKTINLCGDAVFFGTNLIFEAENFPEFTVAAEICEDLWSPESPSVYSAKAGAKIIANLSCSDETIGKAEYRRTLIKAQSGKLICGYVYCDAGNGESSTDMTFAAHNIICENASIIAESNLFEGGLLYGEIDVEMLSAERRRTASGYFTESEDCFVSNFIAADGEKEIARNFAAHPFVPSDNAELNKRLELILNIQTKGLEKRLKHTGAKTAVVGISGGLDSALALLVTSRAFKALGKSDKDIIAVTMPGFGTTGRTYDNSIKLINSLAVTCKTINIAKTVNSHFEDIGQNPENHDVTYENAQARMRTMILMDISNQTGGLVIGTGDLSELALGWATYNGDHMSMYGVNSSIPKTLVKYLVRYEAERLGGQAKEVLLDILNTDISPELLPPDSSGKIAQKTEDLVGPYELHDFFLYYALRYGFTPEKIYYLAKKTFSGSYTAEVIKKWLKVFYKRFFAQQFKRSCVPDGVKVGSCALSPRGDWRMPSDAVGDLWFKNL